MSAVEAGIEYLLIIQIIFPQAGFQVSMALLNIPEVLDNY